MKNEPSLTFRAQVTIATQRGMLKRCREVLQDLNVYNMSGGLMAHGAVERAGLEKRTTGLLRDLATLADLTSSSPSE